MRTAPLMIPLLATTSVTADPIASPYTLFWYELSILQNALSQHNKDETIRVIGLSEESKAALISARLPADEPAECTALFHEVTASIFRFEFT